MHTIISDGQPQLSILTENQNDLLGIFDGDYVSVDTIYINTYNRYENVMTSKLVETSSPRWHIATGII